MATREHKESTTSVFAAGAGQLAKMFALTEETSEIWSCSDMAAMLRHQLDAPVDPAAADRETGKSEGRERDKTDGIVKTYRDLFRSQKPCCELLVVAKEFFKGTAGPSSTRQPEQEVAYVMYLASIAVAQTKLKKSISSLSSERLSRGINWALSRGWLDKDLKELFEQAHPPVAGER
jgi:hypothetical protein